MLQTIGSNRERGHVVIEAVANVEVEERAVGGLQAIDPKDLPPEMVAMVGAPLLSYKYLDPRSASLSVRVTKHDDTEVLVTAIDEAHFETTVAQEGKILTRCLLLVRNTQRQFLRAQLPPGATIWSTLVGGAAIKPGVDASGQYLIALRQSGATRPDEEFVVELLYLTENGSTARTLSGAAAAGGMYGRGKLELTWPKFDIPIGHLFVTLRLPTNFKYSEFKGSLKEVKKFSTRPHVQPALHSRYDTKESGFLGGGGGGGGRRGMKGMKGGGLHRASLAAGHQMIERQASFERPAYRSAPWNAAHLKSAYASHDAAMEDGDDDCLSVDMIGTEMGATTEG